MHACTSMAGIPNADTSEEELVVVFVMHQARKTGLNISWSVTLYVAVSLLTGSKVNLPKSPPPHKLFLLGLKNEGKLAIMYCLQLSPPLQC